MEIHNKLIDEDIIGPKLPKRPDRRTRLHNLAMEIVEDNAAKRDGQE
jgi:hypothetical protein